MSDRKYQSMVGLLIVVGILGLSFGTWLNFEGFSILSVWILVFLMLGLYWSFDMKYKQVRNLLPVYLLVLLGFGSLLGNTLYFFNVPENNVSLTLFVVTLSLVLPHSPEPGKLWYANPFFVTGFLLIMANTLLPDIKGYLISSWPEFFIYALIQSYIMYIWRRSLGKDKSWSGALLGAMELYRYPINLILAGLPLRDESPQIK